MTIPKPLDEDKVKQAGLSWATLEAQFFLYNSIWQYQAVSGSIWQYLAVSGSIWQHLAVSGSIKQYLAVSGSIWQYLAVSSSICHCPYYY